MKLSQFPLGEISAGDAKNIPEGSARQLQNLTYKNEQLTRLEGLDDADSGLRQIIDTYGVISNIWSWKPALRILGRGEYYYLVYYDSYDFYIFYQQQSGGSWTAFKVNTNFNANSRITVFATADKVLLSDGYTPPKKIKLTNNGDIEYLPLGLVSPTFKPTISNAQYTEERDQSVFSEAGIIRVAITFLDSLGIESNPSQISNAFFAQRFSYTADGLQTGYVKSIYIDNIVVPEGKGIESVNIYTEVTKFSEGEDASSFTLAVNYPVVEGDNGFTVYSSGTYTQLISYKNDVLKSSDNISETGGIIVTATGDQVYALDDKFRYLQPIEIQNINTQTFIDKVIRLRLYASDNESCPAGQKILNFNMSDFDVEEADLNHICLYDEDLITILDVFVSSRIGTDKYMEIFVKLSMLPSVNKQIFLAFTPREDRGRFTGIDRQSGLYGFAESEARARSLFRRIDVQNVDTDIVCWSDGRYIDYVHVGKINLANSELAPYNIENNYNTNYILNRIPYFSTKNDMVINLYSGNRSYLNFDPEPDIAPRTYFMAGRFDIKYKTNRVSSSELFKINSGTDSVKLLFSSSNITDKITFQLDLAEGDTQIFDISIYFGSFNYEIDQYTNIFSAFILWSVSLNPIDPENIQTHTLYVFPLYNNNDSLIYAKELSNINGEEVIVGIGYGETYESNSRPISGITGAIFQSNINLELSESNKEAVRCMANSMPLYLTDTLGRKFGDEDGEKNSHFSLGEQADMDNLPAYDNLIIKWTDQGTESFADDNYHYLTQKSEICIPSRGFYNNQYVPTMLLFTENTISRLVFGSDGQIANKGTLVGEYSGYGCDDHELIDRYGDIVYWYNRGQKQVFAYNGDKIINISLDRVEFTEVTKLFVNNATRMLIAVDTDVQRLYSIEKDRWTSATGLEVTSETDIGYGKSLVNIPSTFGQNVLKTFPSVNPTTETTILQTGKINGGFQKFDRVKADYEGDDVDLKVTVDYKSSDPTEKEFTGIDPHTSYGYPLFPRVGFIFFTLTGLDSFTSIDYEIRRF